MKGPLSQAMPDDGRGLHLVNRCSVVLCSWEQWNRNFSHKVIVKAFQMWKQQARTCVAPTLSACCVSVDPPTPVHHNGELWAQYHILCSSISHLHFYCFQCVSETADIFGGCLLDPRLFAGGIFIFPLLSPALASHLKLTQPQLTTIVLAWVYRIVQPL